MLERNGLNLVNQWTLKCRHERGLRSPDLLQQRKIEALTCGECSDSLSALVKQTIKDKKLCAKMLPVAVAVVPNLWNLN